MPKTLECRYADDAMVHAAPTRAAMHHMLHPFRPADAPPRRAGRCLQSRRGAAGQVDIYSSFTDQHSAGTFSPARGESAPGRAYVAALHCTVRGHRHRVCMIDDLVPGARRAPRKTFGVRYAPPHRFAYICQVTAVIKLDQATNIHPTTDVKPTPRAGCRRMVRCFLSQRQLLNLVCVPLNVRDSGWAARIVRLWCARQFAPHRTPSQSENQMCPPKALAMSPGTHRPCTPAALASFPTSRLRIGLPSFPSGAPPARRGTHSLSTSTFSFSEF